LSKAPSAVEWSQFIAGVLGITLTIYQYLGESTTWVEISQRCLLGCG
jgi:hypothetical protein